MVQGGKELKLNDREKVSSKTSSNRLAQLGKLYTTQKTTFTLYTLTCLNILYFTTITHGYKWAIR